jgi:hypothetical protein
MKTHPFIYVFVRLLFFWKFNIATNGIGTSFMRSPICGSDRKVWCEHLYS